MLGAPYPAMELRSPRAYGIVLSTVARDQMRPEKMFLPLAGKKIHGGVTAPPRPFDEPPYHHVA
jgi:hypothetical protein